MEENISKPKTVQQIVNALGLYEDARDCFLVRHTRVPTYSRVYAGNRYRMAALWANWNMPFVKISFYKADKLSGAVFRRVWDGAKGEVTCSVHPIDVENWSYPISFGLGCLNHPLPAAEEVRLYDQDGAREQLINTARTVLEVLQR